MIVIKVHVNGYNDCIRPLYIKLPQVTGSVKNFKDGNKNTHFEAVDKTVRKYIKIWKKAI